MFKVSWIYSDGSRTNWPTFVSREEMLSFIGRASEGIMENTVAIEIEVKMERETHE